MGSLSERSPVLGVGRPLGSPAAFHLDGFSIYVRFVAFMTTVLLFAGALVTSTGSGLAVPDWPLSFGKFFPEMKGGVLFEHGHRMIAGFVGFCTVILAVWSSKAGVAKNIRRIAWLAVFIVIAQGLLGGLTVLLRLPLIVSVAHGCTAQIFFCTLASLVVLTSPSYRSSSPTLIGPKAVILRIMSLYLTGLVFVQLVIGATMRHMGAGLVIPDFPTSFGRWIPEITTPAVAINFAHRITALLIVLVVGLVIYRVRQNITHPVISTLTGFLGIAVAVQILLGALTIWSGRSVIPTSLHVLNGAIVLALSFTLTLWLFKLTAPTRIKTEDGNTDAPYSPAHDSCSTPQGKNDNKRSVAPMTTRDWLELSKFKLVLLSTFTALSGYWLASSHADLVGATLISLGVLLVGSGAGILNHVLEIDIDSIMKRTHRRPLPTGKIDMFTAELIGGIIAIAGITLLSLTLTIQSGLLSVLAVVTYVFIYTPLKRKTPLCTLVGAVPGALPVLIGWTAASPHISLAAWVLFAILFLWQLPHFVAIAWLCKDDYLRAGLPMVTVVDPGGAKASYQAVLYCSLLIPVSLLPFPLGMTSAPYLPTAFLLGLGYLFSGILLHQRCTTKHARLLLLASILYLPFLYTSILLLTP